MGSLVSTLATIKIVVEDIQIGKGNIVVEVFDNQKDFFKKPIATKTVNASQTSLSFYFDIPQNTYAVAVYQDINENNKLDKGWFSIPKEP